MRNDKKYLITALALIMSVMMMLAGCGGGAQTGEPQEEAPAGETQTEEPQTEETQTGGTAQETTASGAYNIMDGFEKKASDDGSIEYLYFNDFMMVMPGNEKWSYEVAPDDQSVTFYLFSAKQEGYGGRLVTIRAFDIDDSSYEQIPSYSVAGVGSRTNKRFVAEYPTDVQWNGEDSAQDADYRDLSDYLHKIGEGAVNSPLATGDSSAEPQQ